MKTNISPRLECSGYALLIVLVMSAVSILILAGTLNRTRTSTYLNDRNNEYVANLNAAEAAVEKVAARVKFDFESTGLPQVAANLDIYRSYVPTTGENPYWANYQFTDGQGNNNKTYFNLLSNYSGSLPSQYPGLFTANSPIYRVVSNVKSVSGTGSIGAVQEDFLLALVPITQYAIFYHGLLEFSTCATMTVNGRTHANGNIYTGSSASLIFNGTVTTTTTISSPANGGQGPGWGDTGTYNGSPGSRTNVPTVSLSVGNTNVHALIDVPPAGETVGSVSGSRRLYNQAQVVLLISNTVVTARIQAAVVGAMPGADATPIILRCTNTPTALATNFPWLTTSNTFTDQRESKTVLTTQIDLGAYNQWLRTNASVLIKFPLLSGTYPTILFAADNRTNASSSVMTAIRITNGIAPPYNGGLGFSLATPNPLYVWGNYNCTNSAHLATTNTSSTVPSALMSDAITILSSSWKDSMSSGSASSRTATSADTVNAAILSGSMPSTGTSSSTYSGGVHNLPRLLENWGSSTLWLNTSLINLYDSQRATSQFQFPGPYYQPPTRKFSYDSNFMDPAKQPPGIPTCLVFIRNSYAIPPPNNVAYNVVP